MKTNKKKNKISVYIDGQSHLEKGLGGIGIIIKDSEGSEIARICRTLGKATAEQAGFKAFFIALRELRKRNIFSVSVYSHRQTLIRQIKGIYVIMDPVLKQLRKVVREKYSDVNFKVRKISTEENREVTELAAKAVEKAVETSAIGGSPLGMQRDEMPLEEEKKAIQDIQRSAGGVVYKKEGGHYKICLIAKNKKTVWALPKGRVDEGETPEETAVREVAEETGHRAAIDAKLDEIDYFFYWKENNTFYHKFVYFFLMPLQEEDVRPRDGEADDVQWLLIGEAYKRATYINEKEVIKKAKKIFDAM